MDEDIIANQFVAVANFNSNQLNSMSMDRYRLLYVSVLTSLLVMTGCFGLLDGETVDDAEAQTTETTIDTTALENLYKNSKPVIEIAEYDFSQSHSDGGDDFSSAFASISDVKIIMMTCSPFEDDTAAEIQDSIAEATAMGYQMIGDVSTAECLLMLPMAAIDPDGDAMTIKVDAGLDGNSVTLPTNSGIFVIPTEKSLTTISPIGQYEENVTMWVGVTATDSHGMSTSVLTIGLDYEALSNIVDDDDDNGGITVYHFQAQDASGSPSAATDDDLITITMNQGADIEWSSIEVRITVDNGAPVTCANPGADASSNDCKLSGDSDSMWNVGDVITVSESGHIDICDSDCEIGVEVINTDTGHTLSSTSTVFVT